VYLTVTRGRGIDLKPNTRRKYCSILTPITAQALIKSLTVIVTTQLITKETLKHWYLQVKSNHAATRKTRVPAFTAAIQVPNPSRATQIPHS